MSWVKKGEAPSQAKRLAHAACLLALGFSALGCAGFMQPRLPAVASSMRMAVAGVGYAAASDDARQLDDMGDSAEELVFGLFESGMGGLGVTWGDLPDAFAQEVLDPADLGAADIVCARGTVAFVCGGSADFVCGEVVDAMQANGWTAVESASESFGVTLLKSGGVYRWAYVSCSDISGTVSVTVTVVGADDVV